jgi:hypothetical protein
LELCSVAALSKCCCGCVQMHLTALIASLNLQYSTSHCIQCRVCSAINRIVISVTCCVAQHLSHQWVQGPTVSRRQLQRSSSTSTEPVVGSRLQQCNACYAIECNAMAFKLALPHCNAMQCNVLHACWDTSRGLAKTLIAEVMNLMM